MPEIEPALAHREYLSQAVSWYRIVRVDRSFGSRSFRSATPHRTQVYEPVRVCAIEVNNNPRYPYKPQVPLRG